MVATFLSRLADYGVQVVRIGAPGEIGPAVKARIAEHGLARLAVPDDFPPEWRPAGAELVEDRELSYRELDNVQGALTGAACAIAQTGTIALDGGPAQGRRALTLLPDYHLCVVFASQVVDLVPEAIQRLAPAAAEGRPVTFLSGPSATADIEFERVVGVHGPRTLDVVFVDA